MLIKRHDNYSDTCFLKIHPTLSIYSMFAKIDGFKNLQSFIHTFTIQNDFLGEMLIPLIGSLDKVFPHNIKNSFFHTNSIFLL
jgi:hypothetical protein